MAIALTVPVKGGKSPSAPLFNEVVKGVLDNSYPAGGYAVNFATLLPDQTVLVVGEPRCLVRASGNASVRFAHWNPVTSKVMLYVRATGAEVAGAVDVSADDVYLPISAE